mmetsp:Transcript_6608/g.22024  ORF Transcript_6608/g.22024 Transcript_6608/m.22024 type:complete len:230 (-) Transcript_6608:120-809(-)
MAAAPTAARLEVMEMMSIPAASSSTPCTCAMKTTVRASYSAVPFMLMVAPSGSVKSATACETPASCTHRSVTGSVADDESVPNAVTRAGVTLRSSGSGERPVRPTYSAGRSNPAWRSSPSVTTPMYAARALSAATGSQALAIFAAMSEHKEKGIVHKTHDTSLPTASFRASTNCITTSTRGSPSPAADNANANETLTTIIPRIFPSAAASTMFGGTVLRTTPTRASKAA